MIRRVLIGDNERVLVIRKRRFETILGPGEHWVFGREVELVRAKVSDLVFLNEWTNFLVAERAELVAQHFTVVETGDTQVAVVWIDGKVARVIAPGRRVLFWRGPLRVTSELFEAREAPEVPERLVAPVSRLGRESQAVFTIVDEGKRGLVHIDGKLVRELGPGTYAFWTAVVMPVIEVVEMRRQTLDLTGQEILTKDKVALRVNVSAVFEVVNVAAARAGVKDVNEHLYRTVQIAVRQMLGTRTLEEVLADKTGIDEAVAAEVRSEMALFGVRVGAIALKDIVLPGDVREILNQVVTAEKQAQANLIRRREEVAATRSLLNTAKLMEENPLLVRLKELEALEKIADKVGKITVVGGLNSLLERTVSIQAE